jgi:hypothetical protein
LRLAGFKRAFGGPLLEAAAATRALTRKGGRRDGPEFVIFGRGRSGSTMLVEMLDGHPDIACLGEILRYRALAPLFYLDNCLSGLAAPVRGFKLLSYQVRTSCGPSARSRIRERLIDGGVKVLHIRRENLFGHAVSNIYAARRGAYHSTDARAGRHRRIRIEPQELLAWMRGSEDLLRFEEHFLAGMPRHDIVYERDLEPPAARAAAHAGVTDFLGVARGSFGVRLEPVTPRDYRMLILNYGEVEAGLRGTPYAQFLPR